MLKNKCVLFLDTKRNEATLYKFGFVQTDIAMLEAYAKSHLTMMSLYTSENTDILVTLDLSQPFYNYLSDQEKDDVITYILEHTLNSTVFALANAINENDPETIKSSIQKML